MYERRKIGDGGDIGRAVAECKEALKERMWREVWREEIDLEVEVEVKEGEVVVGTAGLPRGVRSMDRRELEALFAERRKALLEVRDELDRRDRERGKPNAGVDFTKYVGDGIED